MNCPGASTGSARVATGNRLPTDFRVRWGAVVVEKSFDMAAENS